MKDLEIKNAIIKSAVIDIEDSGFLTIWIHLDYGSSGQGFGGYNLYSPKNENRSLDFSFSGRFIYQTMKIAGVGQWDKLRGKTIRVKANRDRVHVIGHIVREK